MGNLFASQLHHYIVNNVLQGETPTFVGRPEVGDYLIKEVFALGQKYPWNELIEKATGEKLTAKYYAEQYMGLK